MRAGAEEGMVFGGDDLSLHKAFLQPVFGCKKGMVCRELAGRLAAEGIKMEVCLGSLADRSSACGYQLLNLVVLAMVEVVHCEGLPAEDQLGRVNYIDNG